MMARFSVRGATLILAALLLVATLLSAAPAGAAHYTNTTELSGSTNVAAAISWSKHTFANSASEVLLGRDDDFADSLSSGSMQSGRPLLLTNKQTLSPETSAELDRLKPGIVNIMGGPSAVSVGIENDLKARSYVNEVRRFSGPTRVETAIDVARRSHPGATAAIIAAAFGPSDPGGDGTRAFADSIAAGGWAADSAMPVLLTESAQLTTSTKNYLRTATTIRNIFVVGGSAAVSEKVISELREIGKTVKRVSGPTRFDTAVAIAKERGFADAADADDVVLTEGQADNAWASGFAAAAFSRSSDAPIVLSNGTTVPSATRTFLAPTGGAAGTGLVCGPGVDTTACNTAAEAMGHAAISGAAPVLLSVTKGVSAGGSTPISFKFSEPVAVQVTGSNFRIYTFDVLRTSATSAARHSANHDVVVANFPTDVVNESTVAAVSYDAVRALSSGVQNPEGSVSLGNYTRQPGDSRGPNMTSFRRVSGDDLTTTGGDWEVEFTFNKAVSECGPQSSYFIVRDGDGPDEDLTVDFWDGSGGGNATRSSDGLKCTATFTIRPQDVNATNPLPFSKIARGYVRQDAAKSGSYNGPPSSVSTQSTVGPDLTSIVLTDNDIVQFVFDMNLAVGSADFADFKIYNSFGGAVIAQAASIPSTQTDRVNVTFPLGTTKDVILGGAVEANAVTSSVNPLGGGSTNPYGNAPMEIGRGPLTFNGQTQGPVLSSITRSNSGSTSTSITFTFNKAVSKSAGSFAVYSDAGARTVLTASNCNVDASDAKKVVCVAQSNDATQFNAARAAVRGGVAYDTVRPQNQTSSGTGSPNPEAGGAIS